MTEGHRDRVCDLTHDIDGEKEGNGLDKALEPTLEAVVFNVHKLNRNKRHKCPTECGREVGGKRTHAEKTRKASEN